MGVGTGVAVGRWVAAGLVAVGAEVGVGGKGVCVGSPGLAVGLGVEVAAGFVGVAVGSVAAVVAVAGGGAVVGAEVAVGRGVAVASSPQAIAINSTIITVIRTRNLGFISPASIASCLLPCC